MYILGYICPGEIPYKASDSEAVLLILVFDIIYSRSSNRMAQTPNMMYFEFTIYCVKLCIKNNCYGIVHTVTKTIDAIASLHVGPR